MDPATAKAGPGYLKIRPAIIASKSRGVAISRIDPVYWGNYFWTARRLLPDLTTP